MNVARTSKTHPLLIASVAAGDAGGLIGMTFCPGKKDPYSQTGAWNRDLVPDVEQIRALAGC